MKRVLKHHPIVQRKVIRTLSAIVLVTVIATQAACGSDGELKRQDLSVIKPDKCAHTVPGSCGDFQNRDTKSDTKKG